MKRSAFRVVLAIMAAGNVGAVAAQERLQLTTMSPPGTINYQFFTPWSERVNAAANGTVAIQLSPAVTLANFGNVYQRVQDDVAQIGWMLHGAAAGQFPLSDIGALPFMVPNGEVASVASWRLYKTGLLDGEHREIVPLMFGIFPQVQVHFAKAPRSLENLNGLKLSANSKWQASTGQRLGATPVSMQSHENYEGLQRGTVDAILLSWGAFDTFKLAEVTSYHLDVPLGTASTELFMSKKKFEALPAAARKALEDASGEAGSRAWGIHYESRQPADRAKATSDAAKHTLARLNPQQEAQWRHLVEPVLEEWASSQPAGPRVLATYRQLVAEISR